MSQVLDEVPVHAMSLHYLASSEENIRRQRLSDDERRRASGVLIGDARRTSKRRLECGHRESERASDRRPRNLSKHDGIGVTPKHGCEQRPVGGVGGRLQRASASGPLTSGAATGARTGASFGYVPSKHGGLMPEAASIPQAMPSGGTSATSSKAMWVLGSVALLVPRAHRYVASELRRIEACGVCRSS